jgi:hypothetical protein
MSLGEHCFGSALVSMGIRIQLFTSLRIQIQIPVQIQGAKPMRIHEDQEPKILILKLNLCLICNKTYQRGYNGHFERMEFRFDCLFWSISFLLDPDPHSQYGSDPGEQNKCESMRVRIRNTVGE